MKSRWTRCDPAKRMSMNRKRSADGDDGNSILLMVVTLSLSECLLAIWTAAVSRLNITRRIPMGAPPPSYPRISGR
ncbi:hypothetical protein BDN71DRAFT_1448851 [Pleurotus eryngii]|uniref:Uncharacterized protein n=1 Tax=Pleurotus eryngii TaxID=5323 RepID=A0A9P5ZVZ5_PLEER|nr:hypothetical protein BDN71DRAFT_1448851 [Pleurotus eryngii]